MHVQAAFRKKYISGFVFEWTILIWLYYSSKSSRSFELKREYAILLAANIYGQSYIASGWLEVRVLAGTDSWMMMLSSLLFVVAVVVVLLLLLLPSLQLSRGSSRARLIIWSILFSAFDASIYLSRRWISNFIQETFESLFIITQGSKWDGMKRYVIPGLPLAGWKHTGTCPGEKCVPVCRKSIPVYRFENIISIHISFYL